MYTQEYIDKRMVAAQARLESLHNKLNDACYDEEHKYLKRQIKRQKDWIVVLEKHRG